MGEDMNQMKKIFAFLLAAGMSLSVIPAVDLAAVVSADEAGVTLTVVTAPGASVAVGEVSGTADDNGHAVLSVPEGEWFAQISCSGYEPAYIDLILTEDATLTCSLHPDNTLTSDVASVIDRSTDGYYNDKSTAEAAFDGSLSGEGWQSKSWASGDYVGVMFGSAKTVASAAVWWEASTRATATSDGYAIQYTIDGTTWQDVPLPDCEFGATTFNGTVYDTVVFTPVTAVGVRLEVRSVNDTKYAAKVRELHVYADRPAAAVWTLENDADRPAEEVHVSDLRAQYRGDGNSLRLMAAVDSLDYLRVGFTLVANGGEARTYTDKYVYREVNGMTAEDFGVPGGYLFVLVITDLPETFTLEAQAFAETIDQRYQGEKGRIRRTGDIVQTYDETIRFSSSFETDESVNLSENKVYGWASNVTTAGTSVGTSPMTTVRSGGPSVTFGGIGATGWTGDKTLKINGVHSGHGAASCQNVLFENVDISVTEDTYLSYLLYPSTLSVDHYDYQYTQMYLSVDAVFTDGTYLSDLGAVDQNGFGLDPVSQGESDALYTNQWNFIRANIGQVAAGKTIKSLLISYKKPDNQNSGDSEFLAYLDDLTVSDITGTDYDHLADYVNILRGTNSTSEFSRGLATPAVAYPHGFNTFTPVTDAGNNLPYYYHLSGDRTTLSSLSITHTASYWVGDYATWQFMPSTALSAGNLTASTEVNADSRKASFTHANETATAYYYSVQFDEGSGASNVRVEITPTMYGGVVRFTFPSEAAARTLLFDCENGAGSLTLSADGKSLTAWADDLNTGARRLYIYATFDTPYASRKNFGKAGAVTFPDGTVTVEMSIATSFISTTQAKKNYGYDFAESNDFEEVCDAARQIWDDTLDVIEIEGATFTQRVTFYSALYRASLYPALYTENTGTAEAPIWQYASPYTGSNTSPTIVDGGLVCNTGLWDTYRTAWPWYSTLSKDTTLMEGLLQHYREYGWNGAWIGVKGFQCMIGTHSDIIYADGMVKGLRYNYDVAMLSMLRNAATVRENGSVGREENETAVFTGYVTNSTPRGLSWTLDNALNDFGLYVMAEALGMSDEAAYYKNRAKVYVNVFYRDAGFYVGKDAEGNWSKTAAKYDPTEWLSDYTESNGWNMAFNMVYDAAGMASLYGGIDAMAEKLDELFSTPMTNVNKNSIHEVRESREVRLGQYAHSNQVAHHLTYMYVFCGQPYKTQELVRSVLSRCYVGSEIGQGYVGDEDNGEQSAWYLYSALGFYPVAPGTGQYVIGSPLFDKVTLHLETGDVTITANNNSSENIYIASCTVDGKVWNKPYITQEMLDSGCEIVFEMTDKPTDWGAAESDRPYSLTAYGEDVDHKTDFATSSTVTANGTDTANLIDDTSLTASLFDSGRAEILVTASEEKTAQMVTLTSSTEELMLTGYALYVSDDGNTWTQVDSRTDLSFEWAQYTRPFLIPEENRGTYRYYKIVLSADAAFSLAEVELIG